MTRPYYVYAHFRKTDGRVFYIGKGAGTRAYANSSRNAHWHNINNKHGRTIKIVRRFHNEFCALSFEAILIGAVGLENLANKADGGSCNSGWKHSNEWKEAASIMRSGPNNPNYKKEMSQDQKDKIAKSLKGRPSPRKGVPANHDAKRQAATMRKAWSEAGPDSPLRGIVKSDGFLNKRKTSKAVKTECGMRFDGMADAVKWLRCNGWPKCSHAPISLCCNGKFKTAYGYIWSFDDGK